MEEEEEKNYAQQVEEQHQEALRVLQGCADCREAHVVAEGVAEHRANEVSWGEREQVL